MWDSPKPSVKFAVACNNSGPSGHSSVGTTAVSVASRSVSMQAVPVTCTASTSKFGVNTSVAGPVSVSPSVGIVSEPGVRRSIAVATDASPMATV